MGLRSSFFGKYPAMDIRPLLPERIYNLIGYCRSAMAQKLFSTGPGGFRRAKRKETIDDLERTSCDNLFHSEMVLGKNENL